MLEEIERKKADAEQSRQELARREAAAAKSARPDDELPPAKG